MSTLTTKAFWVSTFERTISTAAETALGVLAGTSIELMDWGQALVIVAGAAAATVLKCIVADTKENPGPSIGGVETLGTRIG